MKILICGSQSFEDYRFLEKSCLDIIAQEQYNYVIPNKQLEFLSGNNPRGGDYLGEKFARKYGFTPKLFPAKWNDLTEQPVFIKSGFYGDYNAYAGFNRNQKMIDYMLQNGGGIVIAFRIKNSPGTSDTIKRAKKAGLKTFQFDYDKEKMKVWNK